MAVFYLVQWIVCDRGELYRWIEMAMWKAATIFLPIPSAWVLRTWV